MARRRWITELSFHVVRVYETSLVLERYARTCSLHQSFGYDCDREHTHNVPVRRDQFANSDNMKAGAYCMLFLCSMSSLFADEQTDDDSLPSMAFIEFLGEWETEEGEWIDPIELENEEIGKLIESTSETKTNISNEN